LSSASAAALKRDPGGVPLPMFFTADDEDKALIMSVMARFPLFRETGKKLLNLNGEGLRREYSPQVDCRSGGG